MARAITSALATFPVVVVTGPRQSGKTTLLRTEFGARFRYVSLEDPDVRARCRADPRAFMAEATCRRYASGVRAMALRSTS